MLFIRCNQRFVTGIDGETPGHVPSHRRAGIPTHNEEHGILIIWFLLGGLILLAFLWASTYGFIKIGVATIPPVTLAAARTILAAAILWAILVLRGIAMPRDVATWRRFFLQACLNTVIPFTMIAWAQLSVDSGLATILSSTSPIFTFLITWLITRHEPVTARKLFGVSAGLGGIGETIGNPASQKARSSDQFVEGYWVSRLHRLPIPILSKAYRALGNHYGHP